MSSNIEKIGDYEIHPAATFFRLLDGEQFAKLVKDVKANGLREPVALLDGKLLDGRNRVRACLKAGVKPDDFELPPDTDPVAYVISKNIHRRHLQTGERLALLKKIPAEVIEQAKAVAKTAKMKGQKAGGRGKKQTRGSREPRVSTAKAKGNIVGLSASTVKKFETIEKRDPELAKQVVEGKLTAKAAHQKVKKPAKGNPKKNLTLAERDADYNEQLQRIEAKKKAQEEHESPYVLAVRELQDVCRRFAKAVPELDDVWHLVRDLSETPAEVGVA